MVGSTQPVALGVVAEASGGMTHLDDRHRNRLATVLQVAASDLFGLTAILREPEEFWLEPSSRDGFPV